MEKPPFWARRKFLNKQGYHSSAHYIVSVKCEEGVNKRDGNKPWRSVETDFTLADCSRSIRLDFDLGHWSGSDPEAIRKARANTLYKAHLLQDVVNDFVEHLEAAAEWLEDQE